MYDTCIEAPVSSKIVRVHLYKFLQKASMNPMIPLLFSWHWMNPTLLDDSKDYIWITLETFQFSLNTFDFWLHLNHLNLPRFPMTLCEGSILAVSCLGFIQLHHIDTAPHVSKFPCDCIKMRPGNMCTLVRYSIFSCVGWTNGGHLE